MKRRTFIILLLFVIVAAAYWLLPFSGDVFIVLDREAPPAWPTVRIEPAAAQAGEPATLVVADTTPWVHVKLLINGEESATLERTVQTPLGWEWFWSFTVPEGDRYTVSLFHDCDQGCVTWAEREINTAVNAFRAPSRRQPTKLGVVFANPERNWHQRSGWVVELTYAQLAEQPYWGIDDLAQRVQTAVRAGHRVLLRIDYDQGQTIPPPDDPEALTVYLEYLRRLARDDRLRGVYGFVIGSSYNSIASADQGKVTPVWYARVFSGYGVVPTSQDNVAAVVRAEAPTLRLLVGPVQPWVAEQSIEQPFTVDAPWLNYFHTLLGYLEEAAQSKTAVGIPLAAPDGFAVQAFGHPDSPLLGSTPPAQEPLTSLPDPAWNGAQAGFRVYADWLAVINSHDSFAGLPVYITAANTYDAAANTPPSRNTPPGWLTNAYTAVQSEPQIYALCWFVDDFPFDDQWTAFRLTNPQGDLVETAVEFEALLQLED